MMTLDDLYSRISAYAMLNGHPPPHIVVKPSEMRDLMGDVAFQWRNFNAPPMGFHRHVFQWGAHQVEIKVVDIDTIFEQVVLGASNEDNR